MYQEVGNKARYMGYKLFPMLYSFSPLPSISNPLYHDYAAHCTLTLYGYYIYCTVYVTDYSMIPVILTFFITE